VLVVGRLQARRERRRVLQVPGEVAEDVVGELGDVCVVRRMLSIVRCVLPCLFLSPAAGEFTFLL
jgi:hypothetical protein